MKFKKVLAFLMMAVLLLPYNPALSASAKANEQKDGKYASGEIIVKLKTGKSPKEIDKDNSSWHKVVEGRWADGERIYRKAVKAGEEKNEVDKFTNNPNVEWSELNRLAQTEMLPDDPYYNSTGSWGQSFDDLWGIKRIKAAEAWDASQGQGIVVAVVDSGVDYSHPDLNSNIWQNPGEIGLDDQGRDKKLNGIDDDNNGYVDDWHGWDMSTITTETMPFGSVRITGEKLRDNDPMDDNGHGTHVSGTIAAAGNNGIGVIGVAPQAKIMPLKFLSNGGSGYDTDAVEAIIYAADNGANIINCSWGQSGYSHLLDEAIKYAHSKNITIVAAAGNTGGENWNHLPSSLSEVIAVSAVDNTNSIAWFSSYGKVDVAAPGVEILSTKSSQSIDTYDVVGSEYQILSGTSMASPHVAGEAALLLAVNPRLTNEQVRQIISISSVDSGDAQYDQKFGFGMVDATRASNSTELGESLISTPLGIIPPSSQSVTGTASANLFSSYALEYGMGSFPTDWINIAESSESVNEGVLGIWQADELTGGYYTLRLTVRDTAGNSYQNRCVVYIDTPFSFSEPSVSVVSAQEARISWGTSRLADNIYLEYGVDTSYGRQGYQKTYPQYETQLLELLPNTTYHFRFVAEEFAKIYYSQDYSFSTPSQSFSTSNIEINPEAHRAVVKWQTAVPTYGSVRFNDSYWQPEYSFSGSTEKSDGVLTTNHEIELTNLRDGLEHYLIINSSDSEGNGTTSAIQSFNTPKGQYPIVSNIAISNVTDNSATISWDTDIPAKSEVSYNAYADGPAYVSESKTIKNDEFLQHHSVTAYPLYPISHVNFRLTAISQDNSETTDWASTMTAQNALIHDIVIIPERYKTTVSWKTDYPTISQYVGYGCEGSGFLISQSAAANPGLDHIATIMDLPLNKSCTLQIESVDERGNKLLSDIQSFNTPDLLPDTTPPSGSFTISDGEPYTRVNQMVLKFQATDDIGVTGVKVKSDRESDWYSTSFNEFIYRYADQDGPITYSVIFLDRAGNESPIYSQSIIIDRSAPTASQPMVLENPTSNRGPTFTWQASIDELSGIAGYRFYLQNSNGVYWAYNQPVIENTYTPDRDLNYGVYDSWVEVVDMAGNIGISSPRLQIEIAAPADTQAPTGSVLINGDNSFSNSIAANLTLSATDNIGVSEMQFSYDNIVWTPWESYSSSRDWPLASGNGTRTVFVRYRDAAGNISLVYSDSIILDTLSPTGTISINGGAAYANVGNVTLSVSAFDANEVAEVQLSNDGSNFAPMPYAESISWNLAAGDGSKMVYLRVKDKAGNISQNFADSIIFDTVGPLGSININSGAVTAKSQSVTLNISASDGLSGLSQMRFSNDGVTWSAWQAYAATKAWSLATGKGTKTVYAQYSDKAANISISFYDSIIRK